MLPKNKYLFKKKLFNQHTVNSSWITFGGVIATTISESVIHQTSLHLMALHHDGTLAAAIRTLPLITSAKQHRGTPSLALISI